MPRLTLTDYAKHRGCFPRAVEAAIQSGRIKRDADGLIDSEQADIDWDANTSPYRSAASKANGQRGQAIRKALEGKPEAKPAASAPAAAAPAAKKEPTDFGDYARARAQREHYQAEQARFNFERMQGLYVLKSEVEAAATEFGKVFRIALLAIPERLCHELAFDTDADHIRDVLSHELHCVIEQAFQSGESRKVANG